MLYIEVPLENEKWDENKKFRFSQHRCNQYKYKFS